MSTLQFVVIILCCAVIPLIVFFLSRRRGDDGTVQEAINRLESIHNEREKAMQQMHAAQIQEMRTQFEHQRQQEADQARHRLEELREQTAAQFQALAAAIGREQTTSLRDTNKEQLDALLTPLRLSLKEFKESMSQYYTAENATRVSLGDQITRLRQLNNNISEETRALTRALRSDSKVQGDWGEMILVQLLEKAGLERGINFEVQATRNDDGTKIQSDEGRSLRPDVILHLPGARNIIIDSKVSLTAYVQLVNAEDEAKRTAASKAHLHSVRAHVDELAGKDYATSVTGSPEVVFMFIPNEGAYMAAARLDPDLWEYAYRRHIAILAPTHLYSMMQMVSQLWVRERQTANTLEIAKTGGALYDQFVAFLEELSALGTALDKATTQYEKCRKRLCSGNQNLIRQTEKLKTLGAKVKKTIPTTSLESAD